MTNPNSIKASLEVLFHHGFSDSAHKKYLRIIFQVKREDPESFWNILHSTLQNEMNLDASPDVILNIQQFFLKADKILDMSDHNIPRNEENLYHIIWNVTIPFIKKIWEKILRLQNNLKEVNTNTRLLNSYLRNMNYLLQNRKVEWKKLYNYLNVSKNIKEFFPIISSTFCCCDLRLSFGSFCVLLLLIHEEYSTDFLNSIVHKYSPDFNVNDTIYLVLLHGICCHADSDILFKSNSCKSWDITILNFTLNSFYESQSADVVLLCSKILKVFTTSLLKKCQLNNKLQDSSLSEKFSLETELCEKFFKALLIMLEHYIDCVRHIAREIYGLFIEIQLLLNYKEALAYFTNYCKCLLSMTLHKNSLVLLKICIPLIGSSLFINSQPNFVTSLFELLSDPLYSSCTYNLLESLMIKHISEVESATWHDYWIYYFVNTFNYRMLSYGFENLLRQFFLLSKDVSRSLNYLISNPEPCKENMCVFIIAAKICLQNPNFRKLDSSAYLWKGIIPFSFLTKALEDGDEQLNILAFNLVCQSPQSTELFHSTELDSILIYIQNNISSQDSAFRQQIIKNLKSVFNRIDKGLRSKYKLFRNNESEWSTIIEVHEKFLINLFNSLVSNLYEGYNFPTRHTSLLVLEHLSKVDTKFLVELKKCFVSTTYRDTLVLSFADTYECNIQLAFSLYQECFLNIDVIYIDSINEKLCKGALKSCFSIKPLDSVTATYIWLSMIQNGSFSIAYIANDSSYLSSENKKLSAARTIFLKLEESVLLCQKSLIEAANNAPMYGILLFFRKLFDSLTDSDVAKFRTEWSEFIGKIIDSCINISNLVSELVNNSSPEGYIPSDQTLKIQQPNLKSGCNAEYESKGSISKLHQFSSQILLSCGWRCIKEISLLFGTVVNGSEYGFNTLDLINGERVRSMGKFFINQLLEMKHRGAFEKCYSGFKLVCKVLWQYQDDDLVSLPQRWLNDTLNAIKNSKGNNLCATRRSAGVPFIVQAIVCAEPASKCNTTLKDAVELLISQSSEETELDTKVHALNILRSLYRDSALSEAIIVYAEEGMRISLEGYKSNSWFLKNASSLLFSALVTRMVGVRKMGEDYGRRNSMSPFSFFQKYPKMYGYFFNILKNDFKEIKSGTLSSSFLVLMLLARLSPGNSVNLNSFSVTSLMNLLIDLSSSSNCSVRYLCAEALVPLVTPNIIKSLIDTLCSSISLNDQNKCHGAVLCLTEIFRSFSDEILKSRTLSYIRAKILSISYIAYSRNQCYVTRASAINLFELLYINKIVFEGVCLKHLSSSCLEIIFLLKNDYRQIPGGILALKAAVSYLASISESLVNWNTVSLMKLIDIDVPEVHSKIIQYISINNFPLSPFLCDMLFNLLTVKTYEECQPILFNLLSKKMIYSCDNTDMPDFSEAKLIEILKLSLVIFSSKRTRIDLICSVIACSTSAICVLLKNDSDIPHELAILWTEHIARFSQSECAYEVRLAVAENIPKILINLIPHPNILVKYEIVLMKPVLELLVDDDKEVRSTVSDLLSDFLRASRHESRSTNCKKWTNSPQRVSKDIFAYLASKNIDSYLGFLLTFALEERFTEDLKDEEDSMFEKSTINAYRQDIEITKFISESIINVQKTDNKINKFNERLIYVKNCSDIFLHSSLPKDRESTSGKILTTNDFAIQLKRDIEYILTRFESLNSCLPFNYDKFDIWVSRLVRRALIWRCFKDFYSERIDFKAIDKSLLYPAIFQDIKTWLS